MSAITSTAIGVPESLRSAWRECGQAVPSPECIQDTLSAAGDGFRPLDAASLFLWNVYLVQRRRKQWVPLLHIPDRTCICVQADSTSRLLITRVKTTSPGGRITHSVTFAIMDNNHA